MAKKFVMRIAVGELNGPRSDILRFWSRNDSVYVAHAGLGGIQKLSLHPPDDCRMAFTKEHGTPLGLTHRATKIWRRDRTPPAGSNKVASWHSVPADQPLRIKGDGVNDLLVLPRDPTNSGRPVRFTAYSNPKEGDFLEAWDFGAFAHRPLTDEEWEMLRMTQVG